MFIASERCETSKRMFNTSITLAGDSSSSRAYDLVSIVDGSAIRKVATAPTGELESLTTKHSSSVNSQGITVKRHLVRFDLRKSGSSGKPVQAAVYVVFEVPQDSAITAAIIKDMFTQSKNFLDATNIGKVLNDEP